MAGVKGMHKRASTSPAVADAIRSRIKAGQIADRLTKHVLGETEMTQTQVSAGLGLLKKVCPDLSATEHSTDPNKPLKGVLVWGAPE
jgi:hypothetical protein